MQFSGKNSRRGGSACWEGSLGIEHLACLATWWGSCRRLRGDGDGDGEDSAGDEKKVDGSMVNRRRGLSLVIVVVVKRKTMMVVMVVDMTVDQQPI